MYQHHGWWQIRMVYLFSSSEQPCAHGLSGALWHGDMAWLMPLCTVRASEHAKTCRPASTGEPATIYPGNYVVMSLPPSHPPPPLLWSSYAWQQVGCQIISIGISIMVAPQAWVQQSLHPWEIHHHTYSIFNDSHTLSNHLPGGCSSEEMVSMVSFGNSCTKVFCITHAHF